MLALIVLRTDIRGEVRDRHRGTAGSRRFTHDDDLIRASPISHARILRAGNVTLSSGASMLILPGFDPDDLPRQMPRAAAPMDVPTFYAWLLQHPGLRRDPASGIRLFVSGSAPLLAETHLALRTAPITQSLRADGWRKPA